MGAAGGSPVAPFGYHQARSYGGVRLRLTLTEEQQLLRDTARRFLEERAGLETARRLMETDAGYDPETWAAIAEMGWQAMAVPEEYGGVGATPVETAVLMEEMGRCLFTAPYLSTVILAAGLLAEAGSEEQKAAHLPGIAAGESLWALALTEPGGGWDPSGVQMTARREGEGWILDGTKSYVVDGHIARQLLVVCRTASADRPADGITVFIVEADAPGVSARKTLSMDQTRSLAEVRLEGAMASDEARVGPEGGGWAAVERTLDAAAAALACEQVGGAQACLDMAVEYARTRRQFGRPIGSFQAIKHKCADMLVAVESAKSAAYYAARAAAGNEEDLSVAAPLAKSYCSEAYFRCAAENIQIHGGIGFTWEHDAHLFFKRAKSSEIMFGEPAYHRARLADRIGI